MIVGNPSIGSLDYRKKLADYLGGELDTNGNRIDIDERKINERLIQENFEKRLAEKKAAKDNNGGENEGNKMPIL